MSDQHTLQVLSPGGTSSSRRGVQGGAGTSGERCQGAVGFPGSGGEKTASSGGEAAAPHAAGDKG